ncbi:MAG: hypothetical protein CVU57_27970 [Deltaproteobacteria bacterium HGW-Deltaproteobacteria-15]|nr:MAG: hypothetical protein CVU57_27970 [Deltaproteobacteria bacterium HGW-Deltaproteobacteria-15]
MDIFRRIGIAIVMIVPTFVIAGALWSLFHSWLPIFIWVIVMAAFAAGLVSGKFPWSCSHSDQNHLSSHPSA